MHIHILGICGTFMGGIAAIARQARHKVTGCDANVYPPMSTQLETMGIELISGFDTDQLALKPDMYIIGNVVKRGMPLIEAILDAGLPYTSGPQWLAEYVLYDRHVLAVAGTHGKTTTASMLAWILAHNDLAPGFLIGGIPQNFHVSARLPGKLADGSDSPYFVIEADEYDTAFFDKRSKFVHYRPRTTILNNLEYDHADIFPDLKAIQTQFHHLVRTIPGKGLIVSNGRDPHLDQVLSMGCWTPQERFGTLDGWHIDQIGHDNHYRVCAPNGEHGLLQWSLLGEHNRLNALAAIAAAHHVGISLEQSLEALTGFANVKRRMEIRGKVNDITVYDDFAHHPTAIAATVEGLRQKVGTNTRILAVLEPRSNTMKLGTMKDALARSLQAADQVYCYAKNLGWDPAASLQPLGQKAAVVHDINELVSHIANSAQPGDQILVMSNGGFEDIHNKILNALQT